MLKIFFGKNKINYSTNISNLKQMNNKRTLVNLHKDIVLVTRVQCTHCLCNIAYQQQHKSCDTKQWLFVTSLSLNLNIDTLKFK